MRNIAQYILIYKIDPTVDLQIYFKSSVYHNTYQSYRTKHSEASF